MTSHYENIIAQLTAYNVELQNENTKFQSKIIHLERTLQQHTSSNYKHLLSLTDTTNKFPLPSQILDKWNTFANNDINCCFIEFFAYPELMFHIVQELFFIMQRMMKDSINSLLRKVLSVFGVKCSDDKCKCLFNVIKPFLQEHYYDIFIDEHSTYANAFDKTFMSNFKLFYNREILPVIQSTLVGSISNDDIEVNNIIQSQSFKIMMIHVKEIVIYFELSHQQLTLHVEDFLSRELMYVNEGDNDKEVIDVNGKTMPNYKKLILLNPPVYEDTNKPHPKYKAIILSYDENECNNVCSSSNNNEHHIRVGSNSQLYSVFMNSNSMKNLVTSPALSLRSSSYRNLYNFTTEHEHERERGGCLCVCDNNDDEDNNNNIHNNNNNKYASHHHHNKANTNVFFDNSMSPLSTDANNNNNNNNNNTNTDQIRTERLSKAHITSDDNTSTSHMRSLSKKSTITSDYGINIKNYNTTIQTNSNSNSNSKYTPSLLSSKNKTSNNSNNNNYHKYTTQKAKMFHLKRKGKEFHIEEISANFNAPLHSSNMIYQNYNSKSNSTKNQNNNSKHITYLKSHSKHTHNNNKHPFHRGITYNNIIGITSPIAFIKATNVHSNKTKLRQSAKTLNCNRSSTITNESIKNNNTKHKGSNSNSNSNNNTHNKKNSSLDKDVIGYKTNAITKVNISNLLSMQNKKQFIEFRKAFKNVHNNTNE